MCCIRPGPGPRCAPHRSSFGSCSSRCLGGRGRYCSHLLRTLFPHRCRALCTVGSCRGRSRPRRGRCCSRRPRNASRRPRRTKRTPSPSKPTVLWCTDTHCSRRRRSACPPPDILESRFRAGRTSSPARKCIHRSLLPLSRFLPRGTCRCRRSECTSRSRPDRDMCCTRLFWSHPPHTRRHRCRCRCRCRRRRRNPPLCNSSGDFCKGMSCSRRRRVLSLLLPSSAVRSQAVRCSPKPKGAPRTRAQPLGGKERSARAGHRERRVGRGLCGRRATS